MSGKNKKVLNNSLGDLTHNLAGWGNWGINTNPMTPQNNRLTTIFLNTRWDLISNYRSILSEAYAEYGIVQTLVDQPVSDAFSTGFNIISDEIDDKQKRQLTSYLEKNRIIHEIRKACNWARLFGGGGLVIMTDQNPSLPLNKENLGDKLEFKAADLWELYKDQKNIWNPWESGEDVYYNYYNVRLNKTRVLPISGKEAPSFIRPRLRGWGMSELERVVRSINSYIKNQDLIFELLDEAKIDVYQLYGFNNSMLTQKGTQGTQQRVQLANTLKNYLNALVLDKEDKYEQKQLSFNGLSDILNQIRQGVAADLRMPMTKLFGISSAGFNSGEDDIENYNSMIESEIRSKVKFLVIEVLELCCKHLFGFIPQDLNIEFNSLRTLSAEQEENKKNSQYNRLIQAYVNGLISREQFMVGCNNAGLLSVTYSQDEILAQENDGVNKIGLETPKKSFLSALFKKDDEDKLNNPETPQNKETPDLNGTVNIPDITGNKFTIPVVERIPQKDKSFPYKAQIPIYRRK